MFQIYNVNWKGNSKAMNYKDYVAENVVNNKDDVKKIIAIAAGELERKFDMHASEAPDMLLTIFSVTFREFVAKLKDRSRKGYEHFKINIARRLEIGFDNAENEEYEKNGGFMFYVKHLYFHSTDDVSDSYDKDTIQLCTEWSSANVIGSSDDPIIKEVSMDAIKKITDLEIPFLNYEIIIPIFITIYEAIIHYMIITRSSTGDFEYEIDFASLFTVSVKEAMEGDEDIVTFTPAIEFKLALKSDETASSKWD